jgi:hypothetical protein
VFDKIEDIFGISADSEYNREEDNRGFERRPS